MSVAAGGVTRESSRTVAGHRETPDWEANYFRTRRSLRLRRRRLGYFGFRPGERIVEVGCGDGLNLRLLREAGCGRATGTDISVPLLAHARGAPVFASDLYHLALPDAGLDAVLVDSVLHHLERLPPALGELGRVLRPGGRLCVLEPRPALLRTLVDAVMDRLPVPPPLRARQVTYLEERESYHAWLRRFPAVEGELATAGFRIAMLRRLPFSVALECRKV
jgi:ubiquinone/menaquinone biosynthesis C-methylase UbiE